MIKDPNLRYFTSSELWTARRCRRRWWLAYSRRLTKAGPNAVGPLAIGNRVHKAMEWEYQPRLEPPAVSMLEVYDQNWTDELTELTEYGFNEAELDEIQKDVDLGRIMLAGFLEWRDEHGVDAGLEITHVEEAVDVPSGFDGIRLLGKLDVRGQRKSDGARLFIDHKTTASIMKSEKDAHRNRQFLHYHLLELLQLQSEHPGMGPAELPLCSGTALNLMRKVKRTAKANPPFYARVEVYHSVIELRVYWAQVHGEIKDILRMEDRLAAGESHQTVCYPTPDSSCEWQCDFFNVCSMLDDGSDAEGYLSRYMREYDPNERYNDEEEDNE